MTGVVAVHCGAGTHNLKNASGYNKLCKAACEKGIQILRNGGNALEAVKEVIAFLENDALTNAGYGSNLNNEGMVEGDAAVMDGRTLDYGGCGAVKYVKNPVLLAYDLCVTQADPLPLGLTPPSLLVGNGAVKHARGVGLEIVDNKELISAKAMEHYKKYKKRLKAHEAREYEAVYNNGKVRIISKSEDTSSNGLHEKAGQTSQDEGQADCLDSEAESKNGITEDEENLLDTVGAVCLDSNGNIASGCSSGGIFLKKPGRIGQAALYAGGVWADSFTESEPKVAVCTTGCGEYLVRTQLAKELGEDIKYSSCPTEALSKSFKNKFLESRYLRNIASNVKLLGGALVLHVNEMGDVAVLWGHSSETMSVGYMRTTDEKAKSVVSAIPREVQAGTAVNVSGAYFYKSHE